MLNEASSITGLNQSEILLKFNIKHQISFEILRNIFNFVLKHSSHSDYMNFTLHYNYLFDMFNNIKKSKKR